MILEVGPHSSFKLHENIVRVLEDRLFCTKSDIYPSFFVNVNRGRCDVVVKVVLDNFCPDALQDSDSAIGRSQINSEVNSGSTHSFLFKIKRAWQSRPRLFE